MKIAWFSPFDRKSAIGDYSQVIVEQLCADHEVTVFSPAGGEAGTPRESSVPVVHLPPQVPDSILDALEAFDVPVYNLGDYLYFHQPIYEASLRRPGVVILHDLVMRNFFRGYFCIAKRSPEAYARQLGFDHGPEAEQEARDIIDGRRPDRSDDPDRLRHPMFKSALYKALGVIVHSDYARERLTGSVPSLVTKIDFPIYGPSERYVDCLPIRPIAPGSKVSVLTFGMLNPNKQIHTTIEAFAHSSLLRRHAHFTIVGTGDPDYTVRLQELIGLHHLRNTVTMAGRLTDEELRQELANADVVVNLRNPHLGESSASLLTSLVAGRPTVVWDHGFYGEFTDDVVVKVSEERQVRESLERLVTDEQLRSRIGRSARDHALKRFDTDRFCTRLCAFIDSVLTKKPVFALTDHVSQRLAELGSGPIDGLPERMAAEINSLWAEGSESQPGSPRREHDFLGSFAEVG